MSRRRRIQGRVFGTVVFFAMAAPSALVLSAVVQGSIGEMPRRGFGLMTFGVIAAVAGAAGHALRRALETVDADPTRRKADAWVAGYVGTTVLVVGSFAVPILMLMVMVNSDRSLQESGWWFYAVWTTGHLLLALAAWAVGRLAFGRASAPVTGADHRV